MTATVAPARRGLLRRLLRLLGRDLVGGRRARRWPLRVLRSFVVSFLALGTALLVLPGDQLDSSVEAVVSLAVGLLLVGAMLRPLLIRLTVLAGAVGLLLAGVLAEAVVLWIALEIVPATETFSVGEILVVAWGAAIVAALVNWLFDASSDEAFYGTVTGQTVRQAHRVGRGLGPGLLVVQLDGVSEPLLRQAITAGAMPTVSAWLRGGGHRLRRWHTGLPATTPAGQAVLLHGDTASVPSFRWYDKERGRMLVASRPDDLAEVEGGMSDGRGLLADGGTSVSNLFSGDAPERILTMSDARLPSPDRGAASYAVARSGLSRSLVLFAGQMITEWHQGRRQRRRGVEPRVHRGGVFVLLRGLTSVVLRDLNVAIVASQMARGAPVVFVDFVDYDEVAHHAGPSRPESVRTLESLDRVLRFFGELAAEVGRDYEIAVVSDHGQAQGATFRQLAGRGLAEVVSGLAALPAAATRGGDEPAERWSPANVLLTGASRSDRIVGTATRAAVRRRTGEPAGADTGPAGADLTIDRLRRTPDPDPEQVVVAASGSLAHVYLADEPGRVPHERVVARYPHLVDGLADHPQVGLVVTRTADGLLRAAGGVGWRWISDGRAHGGVGDDPVAAYGPHAVADLEQLDSRTGVGDLVLLGAYDRGLGEVAAFEELVGSHGGLGGWQTEALLVHPASWDVPDDGELALGALSGRQVHAAMVDRLAALGLRREPDGEVPATSGPTAGAVRPAEPTR